MLKQSTNQKLPTFLQWARENEAFDVDDEFPIRRVLWGDKWNTITFVTDDFRYSIKFGGDKEYHEACDEITDAFIPNKVLCTKLVYEGESREMDVIIREANELDKEFCSKGSQNDWGITFAPTKLLPTQEKPARQKKRSAKQEADQPPF